MYKRAVASFWTVEEVDLSQDLRDWHKLNGRFFPRSSMRDVILSSLCSIAMDEDSLIATSLKMSMAMYHCFPPKLSPQSKSESLKVHAC